MNKNAMHESIDWFSKVRNSNWFKRSEIILLLNKRDLFSEEIARGNCISDCFSKKCNWAGDEWEEEEDWFANNQSVREEKQIAFIGRIFIPQRNSNRTIFCHVTCAIDGQCILKEFWDIKNILLRYGLKRGALL